jgi:hypothetical protein
MSAFHPKQTLRHGVVPHNDSGSYYLYLHRVRVLTMKPIPIERVEG